MKIVKAGLMVVCAVLLLSPPALCSVMLRGELASATGARWACSELENACHAAGIKLPQITAEIIVKDLGLDDGYVVQSTAKGISIKANSQGAVMYALLDMRDRVRQGCSIPRNLKFKPALRLRGTVEQFPFWADTTMYGNQWKMFEKNEIDPKFWWRDRAGWTLKLREYAERRTNTLMFQHPHPFPAVLEYDRFKEGQVYSPEWTHRNAEDFAWIVKEAEKYGVRIYFLTWNIVVPTCFAKAHGVEEFGSQSQVVKDYTRYAVKKLFDTYPSLGGLVTMGGETPVGCTDWVIENIVSALNECKSKPDLVWWGWCTYPEDSLKVKLAYKGHTEVLHYLQYEQYFKPMADPRIGRWSRETGGTPMIAMGGPISAHAWFTWGNPEWARETVRSLKEDNNGAGFFLTNFHCSIWLARESFCRYMYDLNPGPEGVSGEWARRLNERYSFKAGGDMCECYSTVSLIVPRFLHLVHSQTDHYLPQIGLPLVQYIGMNSMSTYVFEWLDGINKQGRLVPNYGLSWPNPDWGEKVLPIKEYVYWLAHGKKQFSSTTPVQVADDLEKYSQKVLDMLPELEKATPEHNSQEYNSSLAFFKVQALWGLQASEKIRAAVEWEKFKNELDPGASSQRCVKHLELSLQWYRKLTEQARTVYPGNTWFQVCTISYPPPWRQNDVWFSYRMMTVHWRDMLPRYERELELVKEQLALGPKRAMLPLAPHLWQENEKKQVAALGFEQDSGAVSLGDAASYTRDTEKVISGTRSVLIDTRLVKSEWTVGFKSLPGELKLEPDKRYQIRLKYRVVYNSNEYTQPFAILARTDTGGDNKDTGSFRFWGAPTGTTSEHIIQIEPKDYEDYYFFLLIRGHSVLAIDDVIIAEI